MKRKGNRILFDNELQQQEFEKSIHRSNGARELIALFFEELSRCRIEGTNAWQGIRDALGDSLQENEMIYYDWPSRELRVRESIKK